LDGEGRENYRIFKEKLEEKWGKYGKWRKCGSVGGVKIGFLAVKWLKSSEGVWKFGSVEVGF